MGHQIYTPYIPATVAKYIREIKLLETIDSDPRSPWDAGGIWFSATDQPQ